MAEDVRLLFPGGGEMNISRRDFEETEAYWQPLRDELSDTVERQAHA